MTDLEITRLCAEAMDIIENSAGYCIDRNSSNLSSISYPFDPLHDDAQMVALVKKFHLLVRWQNGDVWQVLSPTSHPLKDSYEGQSENLNCAVCTCAAKVQLAKGNA